MGRRRSVRAMPGVGFWSVPFRQGRDAPRGRWTRAFGSRIFNPLRWRPPAGGGATYPVRTARAISARAWRVRRSFAAGASSRCFREPAQDARSVTEDHRPTLPARPPPPPVRSPAGRPPRWWGEAYYAGVLEVRDEIGSVLGVGGHRALNLLGAGWGCARGEKGMEG